MNEQGDRLVVVAHGTASELGAATTTRLLAAVAEARPQVDVRLCFLDVAHPRLPQTLDVLDHQPSVIVPLLLSTGYHVQTDIPAAVAGHPAVRVARHLGPHPLLVDVLVDRLGEVTDSGESWGSTVLVGAGSSRTEAAAELAAAGRLLAERLGHPVSVLSMAQDLKAELQALPHPTRVATYLLAEGQFVTALEEAAAAAPPAVVAPPLGVHPALAQLVWRRYDAARADPAL